MKFLWIIPLVVLAGCQSTTPPVAAPAPVLPVAPPPATVSRESDLEARLQQQRYVIDALLSQQEAWQAQASAIRPPDERKPMRFLPRKAESPIVAATERPMVILLPDSSGVIDLAAIGPKPVDDSTNPFVVAPTVAPAREVVLSLQGVLPGPNPSAIANDRPLEVGDSVESLRLARVDTDSVIFAAGERQMRIPLGRPVRVRLP